MIDEKKVRISEFYIPLEGLPTEEFQLALWYLRHKLLDNGNVVGKHICPRCGYDIYLSQGDVTGDPYKKFATAFCKQCKVRSDNFTASKYCSPIEFANSAVQDAINDFERKVMMK